MKKLLEQAEALRFQDDRVSVGHIASVGGAGVQDAARKALAGPPEGLKSFVETGWKPLHEQDQRVKVAQVIATAGPNVADKGRAALQSGKAADVQQFLAEGRFFEQEQDERVQLAQILSIGGTNVRLAGRLALRGSADDVRDFLNIGQHVARAKDDEHASIAELLEQTREAGRQASAETAVAKDFSARAIFAATEAKKAAEKAAAETEQARGDSLRAAAAAGRAAEAARQAAAAAQQAIGSARAATNAARLASNAAARAASAAANAANAATRATKAAADAATDRNKVGAARDAAVYARTAQSGVHEVAEMTKQAENAANAAADAAQVAMGVGVSALKAADAALASGDFADQAGVSSAQARAAAAEARRHATESNRAANVAATLARRSAAAAKEAREAATSAAAHAGNAAKAADDAADHAGEAATAATQSTNHANAATTFANSATTYVEKAKNVYALAREIENEELLARTNADIHRARDSKTQEDGRKADAARAVQQTKDLNSDVKQLAVDASQPGADAKAIAVRARKAALQTAKIGSDWNQVAAEIALAGTDAEAIEYIRNGWNTADQQDQRAKTAYVAEESPIRAVRTAAEQALLGNTDAVKSFLATGLYDAGKEEFRVQIAQLIADAGPNTAEAGRVALSSGSLDRYVAFLQSGYATNRTQDERIRAAQLTDSGGPELKAAARIALDGPDEQLHTFIQSGQYTANQKDLLTLTHQQSVQELLAEGARVAATAHAQAAEAQRVAAVARTEAAKANDYANQAQLSAADANRYKDQAAKSAKDAEGSAARAAESARIARAAASQANKAANNAALSASDAALSAQSARTSAETAWAAAAQARESFLASHADADIATRAAEDARANAILISQVDAAEARKRADGIAATKNYRCGILDPQCKMRENHPRWCQHNEVLCELTAMGSQTVDALEPMVEKGKWVAKEMLGLSNFHNCFIGNDLWACADLTKDVIFTSKMRALGIAGSVLARIVTSPSCKCFPAGTKVLMDDGSRRNIEDVNPGNKVIATDPISGEKSSKTVTEKIVTDDDRNFNELTIQTRQGDRKLTATHEHPFWSPDNGRWVTAGELLPGARLLVDDKTTVVVTANRAYKQHARTYNITVAQLHTYYVFAGATPVLVHNADCSKLFSTPQSWAQWKHVLEEHIEGSPLTAGNTMFKVYPANPPKYDQDDLDQIAEWITEVVRDTKGVPNWPDPSGKPRDGTVHRDDMHFPIGVDKDGKTPLTWIEVVVNPDGTLRTAYPIKNP
ncbi:polymorphic toxin-type HINT domain-containing protein [Streptomyces sp. NPDC058612]|uniref:polymorphic toxin-type HINT domain-containing protein n=1 Tax=Streptomyces sp. NPDC058612 TaxID=3346555 RepID=UPI0036475A97